jgi:hypothetical protein
VATLLVASRGVLSSIELVGCDTLVMQCVMFEFTLQHETAML